MSLRRLDGVAPPSPSVSAPNPAAASPATHLLRKASSLKGKLLEKASSFTVASPSVMLSRVSLTNNGPKSIPGREARLLSPKERGLLSDSIKPIIFHLRARVAAEYKRPGADLETRTNLFGGETLPPLGNNSDPLTDARTLASIVETSGISGLCDSLRAFTIRSLANVIKLVFKSTEAPLIPLSVCGEIVFLQQTMKEIPVDRLREALGKAPARVVDVLGQLCALLAKDSTPAAKIAYTLGPLLFLPRFDVVSKSRVANEYEGMDVLQSLPAVISAMTQMIKSVDEVFALGDDDIIEAKANEMTGRSNKESERKALEATKAAAAKLQQEQAALASAQAQHAVSYKYRVAYAFDAEAALEISLREGEIVTVLETAEDGWWTGVNEEGAQGIFPGSYLEAEPYEEAEAASTPREEEYAQEEQNENASAGNVAAAAVTAESPAPKEDRLAALERMLQEERAARESAERQLTESAPAPKVAVAPVSPAPGGMPKLAFTPQMLMSQKLAKVPAAGEDEENSAANAAAPRASPVAAKPVAAKPAASVAGNNMNALQMALAARREKVNAQMGEA